MMILLQKSNDYNVTNYDDNDITKVTPDTNEYNVTKVTSPIYRWQPTIWVVPRR